MKHPRDSDDLAPHGLNLGHSIGHLSDVHLSDPSIEISPFAIHHCDTAGGSGLAISAGKKHNLVSRLRDAIGCGKINGHD